MLKHIFTSLKVLVTILLFKEGMEAGKEVVTDANVQKVIEVMGEPEQYMDSEASENYTETNNSIFFL